VGQNGFITNKSEEKKIIDLYSELERRYIMSSCIKFFVSNTSMNLVKAAVILLVWCSSALSEYILITGYGLQWLSVYYMSGGHYMSSVESFGSNTRVNHHKGTFTFHLVLQNFNP
jgi:hypothetical protein